MSLRVWYCTEDSASAGWSIVVAETPERAIELADADHPHLYADGWQATEIQTTHEHVPAGGAR